MQALQHTGAHDAARAQRVGTMATLFVATAIGFMVFGHQPATSQRVDPLAGSAELLRAPLSAPGAIQGTTDPSLPDAAQALQSVRAQASAVEAPSF